MCIRDRVPDNPLFNEEFQKNFYVLEEQEKKEWEDTEAALRAAFICCDAMYCEVIANPQQAVPLEKSQFRAEELEDVLPEYKIAAGVYAPVSYTHLSKRFCVIPFT